MDEMGIFKYQSNGITHKGAFNIYQAKDGSIVLLMGNAITRLSYKQINDLSIDCYGLSDFDHDNFIKYYK